MLCENYAKCQWQFINSHQYSLVVAKSKKCVFVQFISNQSSNHPFCITVEIRTFIVRQKIVLFKREEKSLRNRKYFDTDLVDYSKQIFDFAVALNSQKFGLHDNTHILCDVEIYQNSGKGKNVCSSWHLKRYLKPLSCALS